MTKNRVLEIDYTTPPNPGDAAVFDGTKWAPQAGGGGGGVTDHGALTGLADDDHTQYLNTTRGDARYYTETELNAGQFDSRYYTETETDSLLSGKANSTHSHLPSDIIGINEAIDDRVSVLLVAGSNITLTYDDTGNTITIDATGGGGTVLSGAGTVTVPNNSYEHTEVLSGLTGMNSSVRVIMALAPVTDDDENDPEMIDLLTLSGESGTGQITVKMSFSEPTSGPIKLTYIGV